jgi:hypothetical protein
MEKNDTSWGVMEKNDVVFGRGSTPGGRVMEKKDGYKEGVI